MADKAATGQQQSADEIHRLWQRGSTQDRFLQTLSNLLEQMYPNSKLGVPVTLSTGGMLVSGQLISAQWYFEQVGQQLTQAPAPAPAFAKITERFGKAIKSALDASNNGENQNYDPNFVHLMDAKFYTPGQQPIPSQQGGILWRGRISAVDGLTIGGLTSGM
ncbi:gas vesicle accessory protein GvpU [Hyalangium gracile]|uniref:gas vesicle accessory protein GvpU n=1 Tax=Hyalangium gracile TaxID=394092 RepID=UPI001CCF380B|nr:gas vesicle accessory protein GvpU [Hyalangium gracile]